MAVAETKFEPVWRILTRLARLDMILAVVMAASLLAWLAWQ
jgi:hypothetical protein